MTLLRNRSLNLTISILMIVSTGMMVAFGILEATETYNDQQQIRARSLAEAVDSVGAMTSHFKGLWFEDCNEPHLNRKTSADGEMTFCSMNSAIAQRRFNEIYSSGGDTRIEMVSATPRNPDNKARGFAEWADNQYAAGIDGELTRVIDSTFYYAEPIYFEEGCMLCHSDPARSPRSVIEKYGTAVGFGYEVGDRAGLITVSMPHKTLPQQLSGFFTVESLALVLFAYLMVPLFIQFRVVRPLRQLERLSARAAEFEKNVDFDASRFTPNTRNEIGRLWHSSRKLLDSMRIGANNYAILLREYRRLKAREETQQTDQAPDT